MVIRIDPCPIVLDHYIHYSDLTYPHASSGLLGPSAFAMCIYYMINIEKGSTKLMDGPVPIAILMVTCSSECTCTSKHVYHPYLENIENS